MEQWAIVVPAGCHLNLRKLVSTLGAAKERVVAVVGEDFPRAGFSIRFVDRPPGPFIFSRSMNAGLAAVPADVDVIMSSDDISFRSPEGPKQLVDLSRRLHGRYLIHPAVHGNTFNHPELRARGRHDIALIPSPCPLAMICAVLPARIRAAVGRWDETFAGYGYEDHDYVRRAEAAGFRYLVCHSVEVNHSEARSVYRRRRDFTQIMKENRARYTEKWGEEPAR